jgi:hypothetical protein
MSAHQVITNHELVSRSLTRSRPPGQPGTRPLPSGPVLSLTSGMANAGYAASPVTFIAGHVLQGLCISLLLIAAAPAPGGWPEAGCDEVVQ